MTFKDELVEILQAELECLEAIKELSYAKTDLVIKNQVEELEEITNKEVELINQVANLERDRLNLFNTWGVDVNLSLSDIIDKIPEDKEDLLELADQLKNLLKDIQVRNNMNRELIEDNIQWVEFNMNMITQAATPATYDKKNKDSKAGRTIFDRKV
ncbi:MAG: flagellar protein FlgN [Tissierellia bacterium]|nr:flagellar protein FlgN [Tissierellia bacterium]